MDLNWCRCGLSLLVDDGPDAYCSAKCYSQEHHHEKHEIPKAQRISKLANTQNLGDTFDEDTRHLQLRSSQSPKLDRIGRLFCYATTVSNAGSECDQDNLSLFGSAVSSDRDDASANLNNITNQGSSSFAMSRYRNKSRRDLQTLLNGENVQSQQGLTAGKRRLSTDRLAMVTFHVGSPVCS